MQNRTIVAMATIVAAAGCASIPEIELGYYLAESVIEAEVSRTITCTAVDDILIANGATLKTTHRADINSGQSFSVEKLDGWFADTSMTLEHYDDGRLKSVNTSSTGKGETIIKSGIEVASALFGFDGEPLTATEKKTLCDAINAPAVEGKFGRSKSMVLSYTGSWVAGETPPTPLELAPESVPLFVRLANSFGVNEAGIDELNRLLGYVVVRGSDITPKSSFYVENFDPDYSDDDATQDEENKPTKADDVVLLTMRRTGELALSIEAGYGGTIPGSTVEDDIKIDVAYKSDDGEYYIAIPEPALFGNQTFVLSLSDAGGITKIGYSTETGAGQVLAVAGALDDATSGQTYAEKAAEEKARADYIAQQQRRIRCQADASACE